MRPEIVVEVSFTEWTRDGMVRHPAFLDVWEDKPAQDVVLDRKLGPDANTHWGEGTAPLKAAPVPRRAP
ncbi:MAG: ligase [Rhodospirillales bacterium]|nr:ligase [Rhodospirillales bacterium]